MAGTFNLEKFNSYTSGTESKTGGNSAVLEQGDALKLAGGFLVLADAGDTIEGVSLTAKTFASDNQTVAIAKAIYHPANGDNLYRIKIKGGTSLVFSADLVTSNTINLKVNGTAMTQVTFATDNATTLAAIATQLAAQFPTLIEAAYAVSASDTVAITVKAGAVVTLTEIVVAAGASQATGTQSDNVVATDVGDFYDIVTTTQLVDGMTNHASSGQLRLEIAESQTYAQFSIANT